jgi:hypothetical protein
MDQAGSYSDRGGRGPFALADSSSPRTHGSLFEQQGGKIGYGFPLMCSNDFSGDRWQRLNGATVRLDSFDGPMRLFDFFTVAPFS